MNNWTLILVASLASYVLRALPILVFHKLPIASDGLIYRFLNYAAFGVMGGIIYSALLGERYYDDWLGHFENPTALLKLATLCLAVFLAARFRGVFKTLFICLGFFIAMTFFVGA
ncbi:MULTISPECIES: AzlD domain-containing protein [Pseudomonas]|uniref:Branched-chain amino acid transport protein (AzlD) n=1 Tax=Pseudomonas asplenii TaxID=53407 RepID=A0A0M9GJI3_9PSED|nr:MULTISPECIES: AzlD domain-containing protein [Pseudomonas]KPA92834.1 Branched-chain amino acid transport protein (AzlD) [Pseudomonas fuscovaginae]KPA97395.1 Branched-chain amino acid transport protein (AzlD) [Pseudomonas fuscovaginae]